MCIDAMATEGRKQREGRAGWWRRRRKSVYAGVVKAAVRKYAWKSPRKPGRRCPSLAWEKQNQADALPAGAMAPRNTTQYLMELVYSDMNITVPSSRRSNCLPPQHEHIYSYTSLYTHEDTLDFQHRDFESVFFRSEL